MNRFEPLDWLRGLLALSIMVYLLTCWELQDPDASTFLGRLGIYGVSMFFVLSGLSMAAVYASFIGDGRSWVRFFVRRIFRIWPLLWLAVGVVTVAGVAVKGEPVDWGLVALNLKTLFGFVSPGAYINTGAWSIGNEMVYYALTPALLAVYNQDRRWGNLLAAVSCAAGVAIAYVGFDRDATLASQWQTYIHPVNNLMLYVLGVAIFYNVRGAAIGGRTALVLLAASLAVLVGLPVDGDLIRIVSGFERVVFVAACVGIVLGFYRMTLDPPAWIKRPLGMLGVATYGVYLLHPIVYQAVELAERVAGLDLPPLAMIAATMAATIIGSVIMYQLLEAPMIRLGKRLTAGTPRLPVHVAPEAESGGMK